MQRAAGHGSDDPSGTLSEAQGDAQASHVGAHHQRSWQALASYQLASLHRLTPMGALPPQGSRDAIRAPRDAIRDLQHEGLGSLDRAMLASGAVLTVSNP